MRNQYLNAWTLRFKVESQEKNFCQLREDMFRSNMLCVFAMWIFIAVCQAVIIPRCTVQTISLGVTTFILVCLFVLVMAEEYHCKLNYFTLHINEKCLIMATFFYLYTPFIVLPNFLRNNSKMLIHHRNSRTIFVCSVILLMSAASTMGLIMCDFNEPIKVNDNIKVDLESPILASLKTKLNSSMINLSISMNATENKDKNLSSSMNALISGAVEILRIKDGFVKDENLLTVDVDEWDGPLKRQGNNSTANDEFHCNHPEYVVFSWVLCLIALAAALKLYYLVKFFMAITMVVCFSILILVIFPNDFNQYTYEFELECLGMPLAAQMLVLLGIFLVMVTYHARLIEVTARLDFIWKEKAERELTNTKHNRQLNDLLIKNILPDHVAQRYLKSDGIIRKDDLYSNTHRLCGVLFASIPNFQDFYSEDIENGKACIRVLNEIICDFDGLLEDPRFDSIEKIKTIGSCYMAASGLCSKPGTEEEAVCDLIEFAIAMRQRLREINRVSTVIISF